MTRACGCGGVGQHKPECPERWVPKCTNCQGPGHTARTCGIDGVYVRISIPNKMLADIDEFSRHLEVPNRRSAVLRLIIDGLILNQMKEGK